MTEAVQPLYEPDLSESDLEDDQLSTAHLGTGHLTLLSERAGPDVPQPVHQGQESTTVPGVSQGVDTDWLALLTRRPLQTEPIADEPPPPFPQPTGMAEHGAAPVIKPTVWSRLTSGLGRAWRITLVTSLLFLSIAGGAYLFWSSTNYAGVPSPSSPPGGNPGTSSDGTIPEGQAPSSTGATGLSGPAAAPGAERTGTLAERGAELYKAGDYDGAIGLLEAAVLADGGDAITYYQLGLAYLAASGREHAEDDAELALRTSISMQPDWAPPYRLLAETLMRGGFAEEAVEFATRATGLDPTDAQAWLTLGRAYEGAGRGVDATRAFAEVQRLAPQPPAQP